MSRKEQFSEHQLSVLRIDADLQDGALPLTASSLPPTDGGWAAWLFLLGSFMIEMFLWGFPFSFGVLQDYYSTHLPISLHPAGVSAVGTTCSVGSTWYHLRRTAR